MKRLFINSTVFAVLLVLGLGGTAEAVSISYKAGKGTKIESDDGNNELNMSFRIQGRFTADILTDGGDNSWTFSIPRAKPKFAGHVFSPDLHYELQFAFGTKSGTQTQVINGIPVVTKESNSGFADLEDAYADYVPFEFFGIKGGQYKVPFLKQELTSSGKQQFVDRAFSTNEFNLKRDIGMTIHGTPSDHFNYWAYFMNGAGANSFNLNDSPLVGARVEFPIIGKYKSSESDIDDSQTVNAGIGIAYAYNQFDKSFQSGLVAAGTKASLGTFDAGIKYRGFSFQGAGMVLRTHNGPSFTNSGWNGQIGYFFVPKKFEIALRQSGFVVDGATPNEYAYAASLNYFILGHSIKWQTDYTFVQNANNVLNQDDHRIRSQVQLIF